MDVILPNTDAVLEDRNNICDITRSDYLQVASSGIGSQCLLDVSVSMQFANIAGQEVINRIHHILVHATNNKGLNTLRELVWINGLPCRVILFITANKDGWGYK